MKHSITMISVVILSLTLIQSTDSGPNPGTSGLYDRKNPIVRTTTCGRHGYRQTTVHYADGSGARDTSVNFGTFGHRSNTNWLAPNEDGECGWDVWKTKFGIFSNGFGPKNYKFLSFHYTLGGDGIDAGGSLYNIKHGSTRHELSAGLYLTNRGIGIHAKASGTWESNWIHKENIYEIVASVAARYIPMKLLDTMIDRMHLTEDMKRSAAKWSLEKVHLVFTQLRMFDKN
eukprot:157852_1